jgi:hypothetical protein
MIPQQGVKDKCNKGNCPVLGKIMPFMIEGASGRWPKDTGRAKET